MITDIPEEILTSILWRIYPRHIICVCKPWTRIVTENYVIPPYMVNEDLPQLLPRHYTLLSSAQKITLADILVKSNQYNDIDMYRRYKFNAPWHNTITYMTEDFLHSLGMRYDVITNRCIMHKIMLQCYHYRYFIEVECLRLTNDHIAQIRQDKDKSIFVNSWERLKKNKNIYAFVMNELGYIINLYNKSCTARSKAFISNMLSLDNHNHT